MTERCWRAMPMKRRVVVHAPTPSATPAPVDDEAFRRRLRQLVLDRYGSLDRFYLEMDFSKGHLSQILSGKWSPSLATMAKLARNLNVKVGDFFAVR
jgi:transcriptional regulator with XRE-family HTH domain